MCPERLVHNRERAGGKRVLARQACQRPGARLPAALRGAARWTLTELVQATEWSPGAVRRHRGRCRTAASPAGGVPAAAEAGREHVRRRRRRGCSFSPEGRVRGAAGGVVPADTSGAAKTSRRCQPGHGSPATSSQLLYVPRMLLPAGLGVLRLLRACTWLCMDVWSAGVDVHASALRMSILMRRLCRSDDIWRCRQERSVKPSAQPTLVRTQHLPHQRGQPLTSSYVVGGCPRRSQAYAARCRRKRPHAATRGIFVGWISPGLAAETIRI